MFPDACKKTSYRHLCKLDIPLHEISVSESCEISLLLRPDTKALQFCDIKITADHKSH